MVQIKPIPRPEGDIASDSSPQMFIATSTSTEFTPKPPSPKFPAPLPPPQIVTSTPVNTTGATGRISGINRKIKEADLLTQCNVCGNPGTTQNLVVLVFFPFFL